MAKIELDITYTMNHQYKDCRNIQWIDIDINEAFKIGCEIVAGTRPEIATIIANSDMTDIWIWDDDSDVKEHWYYINDIDGWVF